MKKVTVFIGLMAFLGAAGLVQAAVDEPLVNRTFDAGLEGWSVFPEQDFVIWDKDTQSALLLPYTEEEDGVGDTNSILSQSFLMPINAVELSFDVTMITEGPGCETDILEVTINDDPIYELRSSQVNGAAFNGDSNVKYKLIDQNNLLQYAVYETTFKTKISNFCGSNVNLVFTLHNENNDDCTTSVRIDNVYVGGMKDELWPPNHKYHLELCDLINIPDDNLSVRITSIYSDEPEDVDGNGDGNTTDDIVIEDDSSFWVRAERQGASNGRVYGIAYVVVDQDEIITNKGIFLLGVPHSQSGDPPLDDGPGAGYIVPEPAS
jgi:hypothetical protein